MRNNSKKIITRDSWGRPEGDKWFGFDPERKEYTEKHFTYEDKEARYKKKNDEWFVSSENTDGFVPLKDPRGNRARELERNAKEVKRMSSLDVSEKESAEEIAKTRDFRNVVEKGSEIFTGFPGKEKNQYEFRNGNWYEPNPEVEKAIKRVEEDYVPISRSGGTMTSPTGIGEDFLSEAKSKKILDAIKDIPKTRIIKNDDRVRALNKQFGKNASLDEDYETFGDYDNSPEKKDNKYRVKDGSWERLVDKAEEWSPIENEGSISALNRRYGKNVEVPKKVKIEKARDISPFLKINKNYLSQTEESAIKKLYKDFNNLGFEFEQEGMFTDYIKVIPKNKDVVPMTFSFDDPKGLDAARLRQYLQTNAEYDSNNSLVNEIRSNIRTNAFNKAIGADAEVIEGSRTDKVGVSKFIDHNNEYYESKEYKDIFKKLNFVEQKEEIERRQMENKPIKNNALFGDVAVWVGLVDKYQETPEDLKKLKESEKKLYNSEEYKVIYANKRDEYIKEKNKNNEKLLEEYEIALDRNDPEAKKIAREKIEAGTFLATMGNNINYVSKQQQDFSDEIKSLTKSYEKNNDDYRNRKISAEVYQDRYESLESKRDQLKVVAKEIDTDQKQTKRLTGEYVTEKAKYGGFWGNLLNEFIVSADNVVKLVVDDTGTESAKTSKESQIITPEEMKYYKSDALRKGGFTEEEIKNIKVNQVKLKSIQQNERMLIEAFGSDLTTEESRQNLGFFEQALVGVAGSLPGMLTRAIPVVGQAAAFVSLADLSIYHIEKEMLTDPDFQTTTAFDRAKVSLPYGIVMGALENFGLNRLTKGQSYLLGKGVLGNIAKILPEGGVVRESLESIANKEIKNIIGKGVLKVVAGTLAEGETGAIQTLAADIGIKKAYNYLRAAYNTEEDLKKLTGGEAFSTPKTFMEGLWAVGEGALAEAIGGFAMSTVITSSQLLINGNLSLYNKEDLNFLEDFTSDEQFKKIIVAELKNKMIQGTMTKSQAESALNDIDLVAGVFNSIDENLPESAKMEAFNLINKRNRLEKSIEGKDESLSKSIKEEIKEINDKLTKLPLKVQEFNGKERLKVLEKALKRKRKDKDIIIVEGKKISRTEAETEYKDLDKKIQSIISEFNAPVVETADTKVDIEELKQTPEGKEVERRRQEDLSAYNEEELNEVYSVGSDQTTGEFINAKYDAELAALGTTQKSDQVATLRAEEQAELLKAIPKIESYKVNGKIDKTKMPKTVLAKYNKIYEKYDALISPLLEPVVKAPVSPQGQGVSIKNKSAVDNIKTKTTDKVRIKVIEAAQRAIKTLQSVLPNFDIVVHDNEESYNAAMKDRNGVQGSAGNFSYGLDGQGNLTGRIDINLNKANARTVAHEVAHGIMLKAFGDNPALFKRFRDRIASVLKESSNKALMDFANQYVDNKTGELLDVTYEEYLAELTAVLAAEEGNLSATTLQKIATLINAIVSKITNGMLKPFEDVKDTKQVVEFFSNIANSIREGQDISNLNDDFSKSLYEPVNLNIKGELENKLPLSNRKPISKSSRGDFNLIPHPIIDKNTMVGKKYSVTMSDHTKVGEYKNDKTGVTVKNLMGGVFYSYIKGINDAGIAWASVTIKAAREMVINAANQDATLIYRMSRATGSRGNVNFNEIAFAELIAPVTNGKVTEEEFLRNLNNKLNTISNGTQLATGVYILGKYGVDTNEKIKINKTKTVKVKDKTGKLVNKTIKVLEKNADNKRIYATKNVTKKELPSLDALKKALSEESFSKRGGFWSTILKDSWTTKSTGEWYKFLEKYNVTSLEEIVNNLAEPEVDTANDHDIVAAVKIAPPEYDKNGNIKIYTTREGLVNEAKGIYYIKAPDHPSYPYVVKGSPIGILNEFNSITDYFPIINDWLESGRLNSPYKAVETMGKELVQKLKPTETTFASKSQLDSDGKGETEAKKITELNKKRDSAKKNTIGKNPKLGDITSDLGPLLKQVLNINAKLIPEDVFEDYRKVIEMLSGNKRILSPENRAEIEKKLNNIIRSIEFSNDKASDLKSRYDDFKVNNEDLDYSDSIKKMLEDGIISKEEFDFMKKYKSKIIEAEVKQKMTKEQEEDEKEELIDEIKNTSITTDEFKGDEFRLERDFVNKFIETLKNSDLESLSNSDLNDLVKIIYNINNGFVNHATSQMLIKLDSNIKEATLVEAIPDSYGGVVKRIQQWLRTIDVNIANIKLRIKNDKYGVGSNSLFNIDEMFGDFKTKRIFNSIFNESAKAQQTYQSEIKDVQSRLIEAENAVFNSFKKDGNALTKSQMKSMLYMIQLEYESNEGSKQTRPALAVLDAVIEFAKIKGVTEMSKQDVKVMQDIKKNFVVDGKVDIDKILSSFNKAEISALKVMQSINEEMTKKATFTSYVINGNQIKPLKNYIPQMVAQKTNRETIDEQINRIKNNINPGTESNNLIERNDFNEKNVSPVILNPYFVINQSSKSLLINYHLADPIRTARMTLKKAELNLKENKKDSEAREMLEVISQSYETALNDLLSQNFGQTNKFIDLLAKVGYRAMLASAPRMLSESISNAFFVMTNNPVDYSVGVSMYGKLAFGVDGKKVLTNLKSKVTSRNYSEAGENSAMFDLSALTNRISRKGKMDTVIVNGVLKVYDNTLGRYVNLVALVADNVVSQPDKVMIKPLWFGSFARRFEKITGETIDFNKIISNDEEYLNKYKDALSKSTDWADSQVVLAGASTNPFMGVLKNVSRDDDNLYETAVKNFNRFMNKFMINEYFTLRKGVFAMIGRGDISREDGLLLFAAASQRLFLYGILTTMLSDILVFLLRGTFNNFADMALGIDDDDEEKEVEKLKLKYDKFDDKKESYNKTLEEMMLRKKINKKEFDLMQNNKDNIQGLGEFLSEKPLKERIMKSVLGSATGMILGRNYGNFTRMWQNYLVEQVNKKYGDDLGIWDGEYDPYKDALAYNPFEGKKIDEATDLLTIISGPYAPHLNFMTTLFKASNKSEPKEERTILTRKKERLRYFIEGSGMLNMLPFYKDFRKSAMDYVYKEVRVEKQQEVNLKEKKIDILKKIKANKNNTYKPEDLKHWMKYVEDADYKKKYDDKEEKIVNKILKEYGYKNKTEFEYEDIRGYKKEFGKYSDYSKERKGKSDIENELDGRIKAFEDGKEYTKSSRSGRSRSVWGRRKRSKWSN